MAYPFVVRRLLQNSNRRSFAALRELLYDPQTRRMRPQRPLGWGLGFRI